MSEFSFTNPHSEMFYLIPGEYKRIKISVFNVIFCCSSKEKGKALFLLGLHRMILEIALI